MYGYYLFLIVMRLLFFDELRSFFMFSIDDILTLNIPTFLDPKWVINFALFLIKIWDKFFELRGNYLNKLFIFCSKKIALFWPQISHQNRRLFWPIFTLIFQILFIRWKLIFCLKHFFSFVFFFYILSWFKINFYLHLEPFFVVSFR